MRMLIAILAAGWVAGVSEAAAQTPKNCGYYVEIDGGKITAFTQTGPKCNHRGKWRLAINNLDPVKYDLRLDAFKYKVKPGKNDPCYTAADIKATGSTTNPPFKNVTQTFVKIDVADDDISKDKRDIPKEGDVQTACYAFDISLYADGSTTTRLDHKDPDLEVTEPTNPPPPPGQRKPD